MSFDLHLTMRQLVPGEISKQLCLWPCWIKLNTKASKLLPSVTINTCQLILTCSRSRPQLELYIPLTVKQNGRECKLILMKRRIQRAGICKYVPDRIIIICILKKTSVGPYKMLLKTFFTRRMAEVCSHFYHGKTKFEHKRTIEIFRTAGVYFKKYKHPCG